MLLVHADRVAHGAVCGNWCVLGGIRARGKLMLLLLEKVVVPVILLPLCVHDRLRRESKMIARSGSLSKKAKKEPKQTAMHTES